MGNPLEAINNTRKGEKTMKNIPSNWHLNTDGSYDVNGSVILSKKYVRNGKVTVKFGKVYGSFHAKDIGLPLWIVVQKR